MTMIMPALSEQCRRVTELAETWRRVSRQHMSAGQGCGCGFGGLILQAADFEIDIVEFLLNDARKAGLANVERFVIAVARRGPDRYSLSALLQALASPEPGLMLAADDLDFAIGRLGTTLSSMDSAHRQSRFSCN